MPEYDYLPNTDEVKKEMRLLVDSKLEITEDTISWKLSDEDIMKGKYTLKNENKEKGEVNLILKIGAARETVISIEILDDLHIKFRQEEGAPPFVFKRVSEGGASPEKTKRKTEYNLKSANMLAESTLNNIHYSIKAYLTDHNVDAIDLEALKKEGLITIPEEVSIQFLNNQIDSLAVICSHKSGDTEYILNSSGNILQQKILSNDEILSIVKNGVLQSYPGKTIKL